MERAGPTREGTATHMSQPLRMGILSTANIAGPFVAGARRAAGVELVAVASRDRGKGEAFARAHGIERAVSYAELLADPAIDAIYNPLPNGLHAAWSIAALRAGKHVLCEKPLAASEAEAAAMFAAADAHGRVLLEAFPYQFQPQTLEIEGLIRDGAIGEVRSMFAAFGFTMADPANVRLDPDLGGGALLDAGCYPVSFARQVFGARPARVAAVARFAHGVDQTLAATLEYPGGAIAQIQCSFATAVHRRAIIAGAAGVIETDYANHTAREEAPSYRIRRGTGWQVPFETVAVARDDGFRLEVEAFAAMVAGDHAPAIAARRAASLDNAWTLAAIAVAARADHGRPT
jgi:D-xylose 1-dehydrogenase (NADP+, D-xylono-1,5-lactone-forming)